MTGDEHRRNRRGRNPDDGTSHSSDQDNRGDRGEHASPQSGAHRPGASRSASDAGHWETIAYGHTSGGGLLDDLPEQGRGTGPLSPPSSGQAQDSAPGQERSSSAGAPTSQRPNPFQSQPSPPRSTARSGSPRASAVATPPTAEAESGPTSGSSHTDGALQHPPTASTVAGHSDRPDQQQNTEHTLEPNVIPFRGAGAARPQGNAPEPAGDDHSTTGAAGGSPRASQGTAPLPPDSDHSTAVGAHSHTSPHDSVAQPNGPARGVPPKVAQPEPTAAPASPVPPGAHAYPETEREAVYRAIRERRDVRVGFKPDPIPHEVLTRVLHAAHQAPSVGFSQPWDFVVVDDLETRRRVKRLAEQQRDEYANSLPGARARAFSGLKVEAILDTPLNIAITVDPTRGGRHTLGRHAQPQTAGYSTSLAVQNLWLAARAEGLGVGWVSFFTERSLARELDLPAHLEVVAYLCVGYVEEFPPEPELALGGWAQRRPLSWAVHHDQYGHRGLPGEEPTSLLNETIAVIGPPDEQALGQARDRQRRMTKPEGALGVLEDISVQLAGLAGQCPPPLPEPAAVAIFAGDHGVHAQGVSPWPQEVTAQMVTNFLNGGAVVNAFASQVGAEVSVVDVGVSADLPSVPGLLPRKIARGTADSTQGAAMTRAQAGHALEVGIEVARDLVSAGNRCLVTGDMGISNTTPSAALIAAFTGRDPAEVTGRGTGVDDAAHQHKVEVVRRALTVNRVDRGDPVGVLAAVGGLEHAALAGFILGAAALRIPVVLDGVIAGASCLAALAIAPNALHACVAGHRSSEPGHSAVLEHVGLRPLVDLELRLGEGSGALLGLPLLQGSVRALRDVATFDDAGVTERD
ncbi:nicotinate-nucleotide--dimethylbenzimidazole phosphoribosyltransferase [Salinactinospora qingdaonensis]|uniref:Nicotinate-nucleotide--dimethylbenzimidazole phosphoribosyltransferase n=1 Tax=Salinactinospora qingdaonensis TaxID=702744 RepID=A0ABP7EU10_9ACTN